MSNTVTVESGLAAHFKQAAGRSRYGIDLVVRITGVRDGVVIVRTYFSSGMPTEAEKRALAEKAVRFVQRKVELGWLPWPGVLEYEDDSV